MTRFTSQEHALIDRALEMACFILGRKGVALRVVEDALCSLDVMLGRQDKVRKNYRTPVGFVKCQERARPIRTTVKLTPAQMFQWLVYVKSESREQDTEYSDSPHPPGQEDMIIRYIKHLVRITMKRNSFYVTLGVGRLLYEYGTQEVRLMYDVLTQSDSARMKEMNYLRKQKTILMEKICERFGRMIETVTTAHGEKRFRVQPVSDPILNVVSDCLDRFTPWDTICVVGEGFDPTSARPLYYYSGNASENEDTVEMNRAHTMLHPECFSRFIRGLSQFVGRLPTGSPDKNCRLDPPRERLAVPWFCIATDQPPRDDRFARPVWEPQDYHRLHDRRASLARRRSAYAAGRLRVYVDGFEHAMFDPRQTPGTRLEINPDADLIEVRGEDIEGDLLLATLIVCPRDIPSGGTFRDRIALEGGQGVTVQLTPVRNNEGDVLEVRLEVQYAESNAFRAGSLAVRRGWNAMTNLVTPRIETWELLTPDSS